jgi:dipeptidyl aminopeptidase/acylaminoacyl peptidase
MAAWSAARSDARGRAAARGTCLLLLSAAAHAGDASFVVTGDSFTYTDAQRSFGGLILVPPGAGPFPVIVFDHGQGGSPQGYPNLQVMRDWGAVVIAPTLSHVAGGETAPATTGHCPENLARGLAVFEAVAGLAYVDPQRIAFFGHSKGAYAAIGQVAALGSQVRVAAMTAGGIVDDAFGVAQAAPTASEAGGVTAPFLMFHGNVDNAVPPARSLALLQQLQGVPVAAERVEYDVTLLAPEVQHNLHQDPLINADLLSRTLDWYTRWGLFDQAALFRDGFEPAAPALR